MSRWIDADALIAELQKDEERFDKEAEDCRKNSRNYTDCYMQAMSSRADGIRDAIVEVYDAPSIDIEPKRGEWIDEADKYDASFGIHDYRCSNCNSYADEYIGGHEWYTAGKPNFCPYCGADMREREGKR